MIVGKGSFVCLACGYKFKSPLAEDHATVLKVPISPCPKCKSWNMKPIGWTRLNWILRLPKLKSK